MRHCRASHRVPALIKADSPSKAELLCYSDARAQGLVVVVVVVLVLGNLNMVLLSYITCMRPSEGIIIE